MSSPHLGDHKDRPYSFMVKQYKSYETSGVDYRWLDLRKLCESLVPSHSVGRIRYFTARVDGRHDPGSPVRQNVYLRALATTPDLHIHFGQFLSSSIRMPLAKRSASGPKTVEVIKTEENGSDVNIATYLLLDDFRGEFDMAIVISNDSDLIEPIKIVRQEFRCRVGVFNPQARFSNALKQGATFYARIEPEHFASNQCPTRLLDARGDTIERPAAWGRALSGQERP